MKKLFSILVICFMFLTTSTPTQAREIFAYTVSEKNSWNDEWVPSYNIYVDTENIGIAFDRVIQIGLIKEWHPLSHSKGRYMLTAIGNWNGSNWVIERAEGIYPDEIANIVFSPDVWEEIQENIERKRAEAEEIRAAQAAAAQKAAELQASQEPLAEPYIEQGLKLHAEKKYEEGDKAFEKAIELAPKYDKAYLTYNKVYAEKKDWKKVYDIMGRAIEAGITKNAEIGYYRGLSAFKIINPPTTFNPLFGRHPLYGKSFEEISKEAKMLRSAQSNLDYARTYCTDPQMRKDAEKWYSKVEQALSLFGSFAGS